MKKSHLEFILLIFLFWFILLTGFQNYADRTTNSSLNNIRKDVQKDNLRLSANIALIHIDNNWSDAKAAGICSGFGNFTNPYIIEDKIINGSGFMSCILIQNSEMYFRIENCTLFKAQRGITIENSINGIVYNNIIANITGGRGSNEVGNGVPGGAGYVGAGVYLTSASNHTIFNNIFSNITGGQGGTGGSNGEGGSGGVSVGVYLTSTINNTIVNNMIIDIKGGQGGTGGTAATGGEGGVGAGVYLTSATNNTIVNNTIIDMTGGQGGDGGVYGSGNAGGVGAGVYLTSASNNTIANNTIIDITGGQGGTGGSDGPNGAENIGCGIFLNSDSYKNYISCDNTLEGESIFYLYNKKDLKIENYTLVSLCNPTNLGKITLVNCFNITINNNYIANLSGGSGISGVFMGDGSPGSIGAGIYLISSSLITIINNTISNVTGGQGGTGGANGVGASGGVGAGIYFTGSSNNTIINNIIINVTGGQGGMGGSVLGSGGAGAVGAGVYLTNALNNTIINNTIVEVRGGKGGTGGSDGMGYYGRNGADNIGFGIYLNLDSYQNHISCDNTIEGEPILYLYNQKNLTISNYLLISHCNPTNLGKIALISCFNITIKNNTIANISGRPGATGAIYYSGEDGSMGAGIYLSNTYNCNIFNNTISNITGGLGGASGGYMPSGAGGCSTGLYFSSSANNTFVNNTITNITGGRGGTGGVESQGGTGGISTGFYSTSSSNNTIVNNKINDITGGPGGTGGIGGRIGRGGNGGIGGVAAGVYFSVMSNTTIINNTISDITRGDYGIGGQGMPDGSNGLYGVAWGIYLTSGSYNSILKNSIYSESTWEFCVFLQGPITYTSVFYNSFYGSGICVRDEGTTNDWDDGYAGNYWGDYVGNDIHPKDGIGDTPYSNNGVIDNNPLIYELCDDFDGDGLNNFEEYMLGNDGYRTNVTNPDSESDNITDYWEWRNRTNPWSNDTDHDSFNDNLEIGLHTNPCNKWWYPIPNIKIISFIVEDIFDGEPVEELYEGEKFILNITILNNGIWSAQDIIIIVRVESLNIILYNNIASPLDLAVNESQRIIHVCEEITIPGNHLLTLIVDPYNRINETYSSQNGQLNADWAMDNRIQVPIKIIPYDSTNDDDSKTDDDNEEKIEALTQQVQQLQQLILLIGFGIAILTIAIGVITFVRFRTLKKTIERNISVPEKKVVTEKK